MIHVEENEVHVQALEGTSYWKQHLCLLAGPPETSCVYSSTTLAAAHRAVGILGGSLQDQMDQAPK